jgi:hypothetical protein
MDHPDTPHDERTVVTRRMRMWTNLCLIAFLAIAGFFLLTEHRAHFFGALPYLLLLACPLMHLFMHHGHGGGHGAQDRSQKGGES